MAYLNVVKVSEALEAMHQRFLNKVKTERILLSSAKGRIAATDLIATENLPAFRRSMVDGYAVICEDVAGASEQSPILLKNLGQIEMGRISNVHVKQGTAIYVPTGGYVPQTADAMVMIEHTEKIGSDLAILTTPRYGEHIVSVGEDVLEKTKILEAGTLIKSNHLGLLASLGFSTIEVVSKPHVAILSTGDELVEVNARPAPGQVRDCNRQMVQGIIEDCGGEVVFSSHCVDQLEPFSRALANALEVADLVILSGGSSAGNKDLTQTVIDSFQNDLGQPNVFIHGLAIKPGKPTIIGSIEGKPIIGLPGHPAACFITAKALVEPFIQRWCGIVNAGIKTVQCRANFQLFAAGGRDTYQLVKLSVDDGTGELIADALYGKSGMVSALASANAYVVIPMQCEGVMKGDWLTAHLL